MCDFPNAVLWHPDGTRQVLAVPSGSIGAVSGLNDHGMAVGAVLADSFHPMWWDTTTGTAHEFPLEPGTSAMTKAVNESGMTIGRLTRGDVTVAGVVWSTPTQAPTVLDAHGANVVEVTAINDAGTIVGYTRMIDNAPAHGARWFGPNHIYTDPGTIDDQGTVANGIDDAGNIYGTATGGSEPDRAVRLFSSPGSRSERTDPAHGVLFDIMTSDRRRSRPASGVR